MSELFVLRIAVYPIYLLGIEDDFNLNFTTNPNCALMFNEQQANKLAMFLFQETPFSFQVEELDD